MRVIALVACLVLGFCLHLRGAEAATHFSINGATRDTYKSFIESLRVQLISGATRVYDIPLLKSSLPSSKRFILIDLSNSDRKKDIHVAVDLINVSVVAYRLGASSSSYFLQDAPDAALDTLFNETKAFILPFTSSYSDLEKAAGNTREKISLGLQQLDDAITNLWSSDTKLVATSLIVIIQMVSEAAKFNSIEQRFRNSIRDNTSFVPDPAVRSLEDNWLAFSSEIQLAYNGLFNKSVQLRTTNNVAVVVDSVRSTITNNIALLLYTCNQNDNSVIKMPVDVDDVLMSDDGIENDGGTCGGQDRTAHISGTEGLCVDVKYYGVTDGTTVWAYACLPQTNQQWTFYRDGTIRSAGKCLTAYDTPTPEYNYVVLYNCSRAVPDATKWRISVDGTITHRRSQKVLASNKAVASTPLTIEPKTNSPSQAWKLGEDWQTIVTFIVGYNDTCLTINPDRTRVWNENCVAGKNEQRWALYSDGTIRLDSQRTLCVSANGLSSSDLIIILQCQSGSAYQRWVFSHLGSISNLNANLVMDVKNGDPSLRQIVLNSYDRKSDSQKWLPFF